jgi:hypothetical protein
MELAYNEHPGLVLEVSCAESPACRTNADAAVETGVLLRAPSLASAGLPDSQTKRLTKTGPTGRENPAQG